MNNKLNFMLFLLVLIIASSWDLPITKAQNIPGKNHTNDQWEKVFQDSFNQSREDPPVKDKTGTTRGPLRCFVSPVLIEDEGKIWNTRPTFIWQGELKLIEIRPANSEQLLWAVKVQDNEQIVIYNGEPLQPGNTYNSRVFNLPDPNFDSFIMKLTFRVMDVPEREVITQKLEKLDIGLKQAGATPEAIALAKVKFLAERNLLSDALSEAFTVKNPSIELQDFRSNILQGFCPKLN